MVNLFLFFVGVVSVVVLFFEIVVDIVVIVLIEIVEIVVVLITTCLLYTSDAADD